MMRWFLALLFLSVTISAQTLVNVYNLPYYNPYNYLWGITHIDSDLWVGSDYDNSGNYPRAKIFKMSKTGTVLDSVTTPFLFNHGLAWDGTNFWIAEDYRSSGARIYKMNTAGIKLDSITLPSLTGGATGGVGDIEISGNSLWFSVYAPDFTTYPNAYAYRMDLANRTIIDTIPLRGRQVYGITVKGDTIFYVADNFQGDQERIYAYRKAVGDTLFSIKLPDQDGDNNPKGLHWDGEYLWLVADRVGSTAFAYKSLYKYSLIGEGSPSIQTVNSIAFGDVTIGVPQSRQLLISNLGTGSLRIDSIALNNSTFTYSPSDFPHVLAAGAQKLYTVTFTPTNSTSQLGRMSVYSNDVTAPVKLIEVSGRGVYGLPYISTNTDSLLFGARRKESQTSRSLSITNNGGGRLRIDSVTFGSANFTILNQQMPMFIDSTVTRELRVWFKPLAVQQYSDSMKIYTNASNNSIKVIGVAGNGAVLDSVLGSIVWQGTIPDNPATSLQDLSARQIKKIEDLNNDGFKDLIVTTDNYQAIAYSGNSSVASEILWRFNTAQSNVNTGNVERMACLQVDADLNSDGVKDVVIGTWGGGESVIAINGKNGIKLWEFGDSINYDQGDIMGIDVKRDWNSDGLPDVLATASGNENTGNGRYSVFCLDGITGNLIWQINESGEHKMKYVVVSTDDGGAYGSRVAGATPGEVRGFNKSGIVQWTFPTASAPWAMVEVPNVGGNPGSDIVVGDVSGNVTCLDGKSGQVLWNKSVGNAFIEDLFLTSDINNSGKRDILVSALVSPLYLLEGGNGNILVSPNAGGTVLNAAELDDVNGDGKNDIAAATLSNFVRIFSSTSGNELYSYQYGTGANAAVESVWRMGDIDHNAKDEFVFGTRDGKLVAMYGGTVTSAFPYLTITAPNGGEVLTAGNLFGISWSSNLVQNILIEYSTNNGNTWMVVTTTSGNSGSYQWTVPTTPCSLGLIRITDTNNSLVSDVSDGVFSISSSGNTATMHLVNGWNLVSVPLLLTNMSATSIFPQSTSSVFGFSNGYTQIDTIRNFAGYWVRYSGAATINLSGNTTTLGQIPVATGWNMIGISNQPIPVNTITTVPAGILTSNFFGFSGGYTIVNGNLEPTRGYWIRANQSGVIQLTGNGVKKESESLKVEKISEINISDRSNNSSSLSFVSNSSAGFDLPPVPPAGIFDIRFSDNTMCSVPEVNGKIINIQNAEFPCTVKVTGKPVLITAISGKNEPRILRVTENKPVVLLETVGSISVQMVNVPTNFTVGQNYPNPFNPNTQISFELPTRENVKLQIYNPLGELVETIVNTELDAGSYTYTWNAKGFNSGVYFYTVQAGKNSAVRKMLLIK